MNTITQDYNHYKLVKERELVQTEKARFAKDFERYKALEQNEKNRHKT